MNVSDLNINLTDNSVKEFLLEFIDQLTTLRFNFSTHAMSYRKLFLEGKREMLDEIIEYVQKIQ